MILNFAPFRADALGLLRHATHLVVNESECALVAEARTGSPARRPSRQAALAERPGSIVDRHARQGRRARRDRDGDRARRRRSRCRRSTRSAPATRFAAISPQGWPRGCRSAEALTLAAAAGSLACTKAGAQPSIPLRAEVVDALGRGALNGASRSAGTPARSAARRPPPRGSTAAGRAASSRRSGSRPAP